MIQITCSPWFDLPGRKELRVTIEMADRKVQIVEILHDDWLESDFDQIWKMLVAKMRNALAEDRAAIAAAKK